MGDIGQGRMRGPALLAVVALALVANVKEVESIPMEDGASLDAVDLNQAYSGVYTNAPGQAAAAAARKAAKKEAEKVKAAAKTEAKKAQKVATKADAKAAAKKAEKKAEKKAVAGKQGAVKKEANQAANKSPAPAPAPKTNALKPTPRSPGPTPAPAKSPSPPVVKKLTSYGSGVTKQKKVKLVPKFTSTKEKTEKGEASSCEESSSAEDEEGQGTCEAKREGWQ